MPTLISRVFQQLDKESPVLGALSLNNSCQQELDILIQMRVLTPSTPATWLDCWECGSDVLSEVHYLTDTRSGKLKPCIYCSDCGLTEIPEKRIARWQVNIPALLSLLFRDSLSNRMLQPVQEGRLWKIGRARWAERTRELYLVRKVDSSVISEINRHPKSVLFFANQDSHRLWSNQTTNQSFVLDELVTQESDRFCLDHPFIESQLLEDLTSKPTPKSTPLKKRADRAAKIEKLVNEVTQHLIAARDHAYFTSQSTETAQLLPRPTQRELAKRCQLKETDVSRCLKDKSATYLKFLWEVANNLEHVMQWETPSSF